MWFESLLEFPVSTTARGRFAPSPTGELHFGSLVAAVASYLQAKAFGGEWWVRIEDVDRQRSLPGMADHILRTLESFGLHWDGAVLYQSQRLERYRSVLAGLIAAGEVYPCCCSRKEIADSQLAPDGSRRYPGNCRAGLPAGREARAWRLRVPEGVVHFHDGVQGEIGEDVLQTVGDFVLLRGDGEFAYQLAVVVDDAACGITQVVRGADLLDSTPRQCVLQDQLNVVRPQYWHVPAVTWQDGQKLSKQTRAPAIQPDNAPELLWHSLAFLGQQPEVAWMKMSASELLQTALLHWNGEKIPRVRSRVYDGLSGAATQYLT